MSFEPPTIPRAGPIGGSGYPVNWYEIAFAVKEHAAWACRRCGHIHDAESGHVLTVHHLDGDKANCAWWNLPALCQRCHLKIQAKVDMSQTYMFEHAAWFGPYLAGRDAAKDQAARSAAKPGLTDEREETDGN